MASREQKLEDRLRRAIEYYEKGGDYVLVSHRIITRRLRNMLEGEPHFAANQQPRHYLNCGGGEWCRTHCQPSEDVLDPCDICHQIDTEVHVYGIIKADRTHFTIRLCPMCKGHIREAVYQ